MRWQGGIDRLDLFFAVVVTALGRTAQVGGEDVACGVEPHVARRQDAFIVHQASRAPGCIEDDLIDRARREGITRTKPEVVTYGITADEAHRFGLPCGGTIQLVIEPLSARSLLPELIATLAKGELVARRVDLQSGAVTLGPAKPGMSLQVSETALTTIHGPRWRLLVKDLFGDLDLFVTENPYVTNLLKGDYRIRRPIELILPKEGLGSEIEVTAIVKGTKNLEAAKKLADWAVTKKANELYAKTYPIVAYPGVTNLPPNYPADIEKAMVKNDVEWMAKYRDRILAEWTKRYDGKSAPKK